LAIQYKVLSCDEARETMKQTFGGVLGPVQWLRLRAHLRNCKKCFSFWQNSWHLVIDITLKEYLKEKKYEWRMFSFLDINPHMRDYILREYSQGAVTPIEHKYIKSHCRKCSMCRDIAKDQKKKNPQK